MTGVFYIGSLLLLQSVLSLPFTLYRTFVLEERFGFNRTTPAVFAGDLLKTLLLSVAIGAPLLALLLWFFQSAGSIAWLLAWGGITLVSLLLQYVAPAWIMPLFNRFVPLEDGELKSAITDYAAGVGFPLSGIYVIDGSKRSSKANAFFTGFGKRKRIALFDTSSKAIRSMNWLLFWHMKLALYKKTHPDRDGCQHCEHGGALFSAFAFHR